MADSKSLTLIRKLQSAQQGSIEQGSKVISIQRLHYAQKNEFRLLAEIFSVNPVPYPCMIGPNIPPEIMAQDFDERVDVLSIHPSIFLWRNDFRWHRYNFSWRRLHRRCTACMKPIGVCMMRWILRILTASCHRHSHQHLWTPAWKTRRTVRQMIQAFQSRPHQHIRVRCHVAATVYNF